MTVRKASFCLLVALFVSAFAAQGASAAGTTGYTCVKGKGTLHGEHCLTEGNAAAEYGHLAYTGTTEVILTNANTANETKESTKAVLKTVVGTIGVTLEATEVFAEGTTTNSEEGGEMVASGVVPNGFHLTNVTNPTQGCTVKGPNEGTITTKPIKATTKGQGDAVKFEPLEGNIFVEFEMTGAACPTFLTERNPVKVFGTIKDVPHGSTINANHSEITTAGTLRMFSATGPKLGLEGSITGKARANNTETYTSVAATT